MNRYPLRFFGLFIFLGLLGFFFQDCTNSNFKIHNSELSSLSETRVPVPVSPSTSDFAINVKPIIESKCVGCHSPGQIATRMSFQTSNAIAVFGNAILRKLETKTMPPWFLKNDGTCGSYAHDPTVTAAEFNAIKTWIETKTVNGSPIESEKNIPITAPPQIGLSTTDPDVLKIQMPASYIPQPNAGEVDEYRCFILNPNTSIDKTMTAYQVIPGRKELVHHVLLYSLNSTNAEAQVEQLDA